jgi:N-acetylneuraminic acid mutarotase
MRTKSRIRLGVFWVGFALAMTLSLSLVVYTAHAAIPEKINYQGYLTNASGVPINGTLQMTFAIYDVSAGGAALWSETQNVTVNRGVYNVNLGNVTPVNLAFDVPYYIGIQVGADPEMTPRIPLTSMGYAYRALTVETIGSHTHSGTDITTGTVAEARIDSAIARDSEVTAAVNAHATRTDNPHSTTASQAGAVALNQANSITSGMIVDGTITNSDISTTAAIDFAKLSGVASSTHNHDAAYVNVAGDTMTGNLNLPANGLMAGTNQLVLSGNNVGIGTASPTQKLEVIGNVRISGTGNGLAFPDGTTQTTAVTGGGGGVPSGFMILGDTATSPAGYTYAGKTIGMPGSWAAKADMPTGRYNGAIAVVNNKIYVIGGISGSTVFATNEEYDPETNTWTTRASMPTARYGCTAAVVNNKIYVIGGFTGSAGTGVNEEFDPVTNTWTTRASMTATWAHVAEVVNNKIYVIGGTRAGVPYSQDNNEYDPATNTWSTKASMPTARQWPAAAAVNNKIYVIGGMNTPPESALATNEEYNPTTNTWKTMAHMHTARTVPAAAVVNNKVYVIGGGITSALFAANEEYDPVTNAWIGRAGMPTARWALRAAAVNEKVYVIGGTLTTTGAMPGISTNEEFMPELLYVHRKN